MYFLKHLLSFVIESRNTAATCERRNEDICLPRSTGETEGNSVTTLVCSFCVKLKDIQNLRLKLGIFSLAFELEEFT